MGVKVKTKALDEFMQKTGIGYDEILYMGDDIPDLEVMKKVAIPACPADAVYEIKTISSYISRKEGGRGCGRDVIEQIMKEQNLWMDDEAFGW